MAAATTATVPVAVVTFLVMATASAAAVTMAVLLFAIMAAATTATTAAAATAAAAGFGEILDRGDSAQLEGQADVFSDFLAESLQFALGVHEITGDRVIKQGIPGRFKRLDLRRGQFNAGMLFLMQLFAQFMGSPILHAGIIIIEETLDARLILQENRMPCDFRAEFLGLGQDGGIVGKQCHAHSLTTDFAAGNGHLEKILA